MDFLSRRFTARALVGALCLALPSLAFAADPGSLGANPDLYEWKISSDGSNLYRVFSPSGGRLENQFNPLSTFSEGSSGGVIDTVAPPPLTIDGATGEVIDGLSRSLTLGDLVDSLGKLIAADNPIGLTVLTASTVAPLVFQIWKNYNSSQSNPVSSVGESSYGCASPYFYYSVVSCSTGAVSSTVGPFSVQGGGPGGCTAGVSFWDDWYSALDGTGPFASDCPSSGPDSLPSSSLSSPPSNLPQWVDSNWTSDNLANDATSALQDNPSYSPDLATQLADNSAPLSTPEPYTYAGPSMDTLSEPSSTSTSTDPSTGDTTKTITQPSFDVKPATNGDGLQVTKTTTVTTQTCTSSGSCTTTNISVDTSTPKTASPFVAPTTSIPSSSPVSVKSFSTVLSVPSQSDAKCPANISYTAFNQSFSIDLSPLCQLATNAQPYVEALGAVGAGIVIFR